MYTVNGTKYYIHQNHLFSVSAVTDAAGATRERYSYTSYGDRAVRTPAGAPLAKSQVNNGIGFTGYLVNAETIKYHARLRQFDSALGVFMSRDREGYIDGYGLQSSYFIPNRLDPTGSCGQSGVFASLTSGDESFDRIFPQFHFPNRFNGDSLTEAADQIASQISDCQCIATLVIMAHGITLDSEGETGANIRGLQQRDSQRNGESNLDFAKRTSDRFNRSQREDVESSALMPSNAAAFIDRINSKTCFCKPCQIILYVCGSGSAGRKMARALAAASGCTVFAPSGFITYGPRDVYNKDKVTHQGDSTWTATDP
jgi:hypothetical protein